MTPDVLKDNHILEENALMARHCLLFSSPHILAGSLCLSPSESLLLSTNSGWSFFAPFGEVLLAGATACPE